MSSRIEQALATLVTDLAALSDCTVKRDYDKPVPWTTPTTGRWIIVRTGSLVPQSRCGQTLWLLHPVLELYVKDEDPGVLGAQLLTLHGEVLDVLAADPTLGDACEYCEFSEEQATEMQSGDSPGEPAGALMVPLTIAVVTPSGSVAA